MIASKDVEAVNKMASKIISQGHEKSADKDDFVGGSGGQCLTANRDSNAASKGAMS